jgi:hypothetical protein
MEVTLIHEATHTSIDARYYSNIKRREAVEKDGGCYISTYASDYPDREDIAELMPLYVAVKYFPYRISKELKDKILSCSINRINYL